MWEWSQVDEDGLPQPWRATAPLQTGRYGLETALHGDHIYALGGLDGAAYLDSIEVARIMPDGGLSPWEYSTTTLPSKREGANVVVVKDHIYLIGGTNLDGYKNSAEYATLSSVGAIGYWATSEEVTAHQRALAKRKEAEAVLPNQGIIVKHAKAAKYSYYGVELDGMYAWLAGPLTDIPVGTRIAFPNGVKMSNFYSKELKTSFPSIMFVGRVQVLEAATPPP